MTELMPCRASCATATATVGSWTGTDPQSITQVQSCGVAAGDAPQMPASLRQSLELFELHFQIPAVFSTTESLTPSGLRLFLECCPSSLSRLTLAIDKKLQENSKNHGSSEGMGITAAEKLFKNGAFKPSLSTPRA